MKDAIIILNAGSSSLKFSLYHVEAEDLPLVAHGQIEELDSAPRFKAKDAEGQVLADRSLTDDAKAFGQDQGFEYLANWMRDHYRDSLMIAVGHRMVHGGTDFTAPTLITPQVMQKLEALVPLAPLHQPHNLAGVKGVTRWRPDLPQVACFDTSFHCGRAMVTQRFGLPDEFYQNGVRRWGFHGLSYEYIAGRFRCLAPDTSSGRVIVAHLGNGASLCAMKNGRSVDTTMSFSVLDGLPMGTRCGSLDPGAVLFLLRDRTPAQIEELLYKKSGLLGISGVSNDVRELLASDKPQAAEAIEYFTYRIIREIGSLTAALGGLDALIFTAGIGENSPVIREKVCQGLGWLGIRISADANQRNAQCLTDPAAAPSVWAIPTDEEGVMAQHTLSVVSKLRRGYSRSALS